MAESAVSFLLEQLSVVLRDERKLLGGLKHEVQCINDELLNLMQFLRAADAVEKETHFNLKDWVGQLREISLDWMFKIFLTNTSSDSVTAIPQKSCPFHQQLVSSASNRF